MMMERQPTRSKAPRGWSKGGCGNTSSHTAPRKTTTSKDGPTAPRKRQIEMLQKNCPQKKKTHHILPKLNSGVSPETVFSSGCPQNVDCSRIKIDWSHTRNFMSHCDVPDVGGGDAPMHNTKHVIEVDWFNKKTLFTSFLGLRISEIGGPAIPRYSQPSVYRK